MPPLESIPSRSFRFAIRIVNCYRGSVAIRELPPHLSRQMMRAGTSIGANVEEAQSAYSRRDMAARYTIALREARECRYWLRLILATEPAAPPECRPLTDECGQIVGILTAAVRKLRDPTSNF